MKEIVCLKKVCIFQFYCLCFVKDISMGILGGNSRKERYPGLEVEGNIRILYDRERHWEDIIEENIRDKGKVHALRWKVYIKYRE